MESLKTKTRRVVVPKKKKAKKKLYFGMEVQDAIMILIIQLKKIKYIKKKYMQHLINYLKI